MRLLASWGPAKAGQRAKTLVDRACRITLYQVSCGKIFENRNRCVGFRQIRKRHAHDKGNEVPACQVPEGRHGGEAAGLIPHGLRLRLRLRHRHKLSVRETEE